MDRYLLSQLYESTPLINDISKIIISYTVNPTILVIRIKQSNLKYILEVLGTVIIDWGDRSFYEHKQGNNEHEYDITGLYIIKIYGICMFNEHKPILQKSLIEVKNIGELKIKNRSFQGCKKLQKVPLTGVFPCDSSYLFDECYELKCDLKQWDSTNLLSTSSMFSNCILFNSDISGWDVSKVTDMSYMFFGAVNFNQNLSSWNISNVKTLEGAFIKCQAYDLIIDTWQLTNIETRWITSLF